MTRVGRILAGLAVPLAGLWSLAPCVSADTLQSYNLAWSGAALGNSATATGTITLDLTAIDGNNYVTQDMTPFVTDFSITISGATSGNGTFGFSDFNSAPAAGGFVLQISPASMLDFSTELVGQPTPGGPWGSTHDSNTGDFNIFSNGSDPAAPNGTNYFELTTDAGGEDPMYLTSFAPSTVVPEPSAIILLGSVLLVVASDARKRIARI